MINYLSYINTETEGRLLLDEVRKKAAYDTEEVWNYLIADSAEEALKKIKEEPFIHFLSWDVTTDGALRYLEDVRKERKDSFLLVVSDTTVSPVLYLKPDISPGALLLKPLTEEKIRETLDIVFAELKRRFYSKEDKTVFVAERRDENVIVPVANINYFETKNKKIFLRSGREEYGFYGTIETVMERLPDYFVQCHRSFIVNMHLVSSIDYTTQTIKLAQNIRIPFSRKYRGRLKEYWNA